MFFVVWRRLIAKGKAVHHTFPQPDLFIAATAVLHDLCVVTRDAGDFLRTGSTPPAKSPVASSTTTTPAAPASCPAPSSAASPARVRRRSRDLLIIRLPL